MFDKNPKILYLVSCIKAIYNCLLINPSIAALIFLFQVRLALPPLMKIYSGAVKSGDSSVAVTFEMVANLISTMDRSSVGVYHAKIFDLCLLALDLRCLHPISIQNIYTVEKSVINAMVALTMKLTETMFKPLFIKSIEWAESEVEESDSEGRTNTDRSISFYGLVNKLADNHR